MKYNISVTPRFQKNYAKLTAAEKKQLRHKLELLSTAPTHPSLRTKKIQGTEDLFECSINMDIRIIWHYDNNQIILLLDIGHHNILKKY